MYKKQHPKVNLKYCLNYIKTCITKRLEESMQHVNCGFLYLVSLCFSLCSYLFISLLLKYSKINIIANYLDC